MAITFNDNINPSTPKPLDSRYAVYESGTIRSYNNTLEATIKLDISIRYIGLTVLVNNEEYWFKEGVLDANLILKNSTINANDFVKLTTDQTINGIKSFNNNLNALANIRGFGNLVIDGNISKSGINVLNQNESDSRYILLSPSTPQTANINLIGNISNSKFLVENSGDSFWKNSDNNVYFSILNSQGISAYKNTPISLYGSVAQKIQLKNDDTGLIISNTANQTKLKLSDSGTLTLSQIPSNSISGAPILVRNPTTGNIELSIDSGVSGSYVDLSTPQSINGTKSFSDIGSSTLNGNLDISTGSIVNNYYSNKVAYWDVSGNLIQKDLEGYAKLTANTFTELQQINYGAGKYLQMYDGGVVSANTSINTKTAINANSFIFYNNGDKTNELICSTLTSNKITTLQDKSGTVALLSDLKIPTTGSWTPYSTVVSLTVNFTYYHSFGNMVTAYFYISFPTTIDTSNVIIKGLPSSPYNGYPLSISRNNSGLNIYGESQTTDGGIILTDNAGVNIKYNQMSDKTLAGSITYRIP